MTYERAGMVTPIDTYYTNIYETIVDYNDRNHAPLFNEKIWQAIHKNFAEEEADAQNVNVDTFCQTPVMPDKQGKN